MLARSRKIATGPRRLIIPFVAIGLIAALSAGLLSVSRVYESERQQRQLVSDSLWAEQAVVFELRRVSESVRTLRQLDFEARGVALMQRSPEVVGLQLWDEDQGSPSGTFELKASGGNRLEIPAGEAADLVRRSKGSQSVSTVIVRRSSDHYTLLIAAPLHDSSGEQTIIAALSLEKLLQNAVPWWFAHGTELKLEDYQGNVLAVRDAGVRGKGVYTHRLATEFADRTWYFDANSAQGNPSPITDLLTGIALAISVLLGWTVYTLWRDLRWRTKAEADLKAQQSFRNALDVAMITGLCAVDSQGKVIYANPAYCTMIGEPAEQLLGKYHADWLDVDARDQESPENGYRPRVFERKINRPDGSSIDVAVYAATMYESDGRATGTVASVMDISEQKRNSALVHAHNERLRRMSRLITMGEMTSMLAHEMNQPLTAINSYMTAGKNILESDGPAEESRIETITMLEKARNQAERAGLIIRRIRQFVHKSSPIPISLEIDQLMEDVLPLIRLQAVRPDNCVRLEVEPECPPVIGDRVLLEQILLNLTKNAFEAMATHVSATHEVVITARKLDDDRYVLLSVRDTGPGLGDDPDLVLSSTFSSTKADGMGLGLSVCQTALGLLGSRLTYKAADGGGAEFSFRLPHA